MIEFGETLRKTREAKGLTTSEVATRTHMLVQQVEALEKEDFSKIAAPIYGRGFVKLYCEAVGITDPKPLVDEFMDIYSGNRPPTIRMRTPAAPEPPPPPKAIEPEPPPPAPEPVEPEPREPAATGTEFNFGFEPEQVTEPEAVQEAEPVAEPEAFTGSEEFLEPEPVHEPEPQQGDDQTPASETFADGFSMAREDEPAEDQDDEEPAPPPADNLFDFALESEVVAPKPRKAQPVQAESADIDDFFKETGTQSAFPRTQGPSRYAAPQPIEYDEREPFKIPPVVWRVGLLAVAAALLLWLLVSGISCVYRSTMSSEPITPDEAAAPAEVDKAPAETPAAEPTASTAERKERTPMKLRPLYID